MDQKGHCRESCIKWGFLSGLEAELLKEAEYYWEIRLPDKDGSSKLGDADKYMAWGDIPDWIENPPSIPLIFDHVWHWFLSLNASRQADNLISFSDMKAYFDMIDATPSRWDLSLIQMLDNQFLQMRNDNNKE